MNKSVAGLLLGLCLTPAAHAICEHPYLESPCASSEFRIQEDQCSKSMCRPVSQPPNKPNVYCTYIGGGYDCIIWPRGPALHYSYAGSGPVQVSDTGPTYQPNVWVQCGVPARPGGVLSVTAYSPTGLASPTRTVALSCRNQPEH